MGLAVSLPRLPYRWHTFLHIAGAVVSLGNIIVTGALDTDGGAYAAQFTVAVYGRGGWEPIHQLSGIIWVGLLIAVQHRMVVFGDASVHPDALPSEFTSALRRWYLWGRLR